jgi:uncharacterized protein (DUF433 family)
VVSASAYLGVGLYTPAEAARFIRAKPEALSRWVHGDAKGDSVFPAHFVGDTDKTITFIDMIQALAVRAVRTQQRRIPLGRIRDAVTRIINEQQITSPLAHKHWLFAFGDTIVIKLSQEEIIGVSRGDVGQAMMVPIVEPFLTEISFSETGLAEVWEPLKAGDYSVRLDPKIRFGQPTIHPLGLLADALAQAVSSEGSVEAAAEAFNVPTAAVWLAAKYQDSLTGLTN